MWDIYHILYLPSTRFIIQFITKEILTCIAKTYLTIYFCFPQKKAIKMCIREYNMENVNWDYEF